MMASYEQLLADIQALVRPESDGERRVFWISAAKILGVARTPEDRLEIFLVGPQLHSARRGLRDALEFGTWFRGAPGTKAFDANRLILPAAGHFDQVAAFACTELSRAGVDEDLASAFSQSEPVLDLVLERLRLSDGALLGLFGEMLILDSLTHRASDDDLPLVVENWGGWKQSLRDLSWGTVGIEVKSTTRSTSTHEVQGVHQVELNDGLAGGPIETGLTLVSVGVNRAVAHENTLTVPVLIERVCTRLKRVGRDDLHGLFVSRVREYGSGTGFGYDHSTMANDSTFAQPFEVIFVRGYDMTDPGVSVLRRADVVSHNHVDPASLRYVIDLPVTVSGDLNPTVGLKQVARSVLGY